LEESSDDRYYPLIVDKNGDLIYPVGERILRFASDDAVQSGDLPQVGLYCHDPKSRNFVSSSSIKPLAADAPYVPLRCNNAGKFTIFNGTSDEEIDIYKARCTEKQYPILLKHKNEVALCSNLGADGRNNDLENSIRTVQIGWNMSEINPNMKIKEMIKMCIDEKVFGTLWTRHIVHGKSIDFQDKGPRGNFRNDNPGQKRFFNGGASSRLESMYSKDEQRIMINSTLNINTAEDAANVDRYNNLNGKPIIEERKNFFAKGICLLTLHLSISWNNTQPTTT